jgi:NAD-dependent dihydropyrimidine dehydrogenase PreA subunit
MIYVNDTACNGCGACMDSCPTGALIFQNNRAFIEQDLCQSCEVCLDACPQGAILSGERLPALPEIIHMPEVPSQVIPNEQFGLRSIVLSAIGSLFLWTGRELVPRLADVALGYLDQRLQASQPEVPQTLSSRGRGRVSKSPGQKGRGRCRHRQRRNRRFV